MEILFKFLGIKYVTNNKRKSSTDIRVTQGVRSWEYSDYKESQKLRGNEQLIQHSK